MKLKAKRSFIFRSLSVTAGEEFEAKDLDADILIRKKLAEPITEPEEDQAEGQEAEPITEPEEDQAEGQEAEPITEPEEDQEAEPKAEPETIKPKTQRKPRK